MSQVFGVHELQAALDDMVTRAQVAAKTIVRRSEVVVEAEAKKQFTGAHKRGTPTTSAPGSPPDVVTGTLRRSITTTPVKVSGIVATGSVYPSAVYARIQELGGGNLPARPYMSPAYDASKDAIARIAHEEWANAVRP